MHFARIKILHPYNRQYSRIFVALNATREVHPFSKRFKIKSPGWCGAYRAR